MQQLELEEDESEDDDEVAQRQKEREKQEEEEEKEKLVRMAAHAKSYTINDDEPLSADHSIREEVEEAEEDDEDSDFNIQHILAAENLRSKQAKAAASPPAAAFSLHDFGTQTPLQKETKNWEDLPEF